MSTDNLIAQAAQAAFGNLPPMDQAGQDALLAHRIQQNKADGGNVSNNTADSTSSQVIETSTTNSNTAADTATASQETTTSSGFDPEMFNQYLSEKTGGKIKSWDEVESYLNNADKPKYNSEIAEKIDSYLSKGGKLDENWFRLQTKDYSTIENPIDLFREKMKIENPELSDIEIEYELNERYKLDQWEDDDESPLQQAMSAKIAREAKQALDFLVDNQKKSSVFSEAKTPEQLEAEQAAMAQMVEADKQARTKFSDDVRAAVSEIEKLKFSPIDGFEVDYSLNNDEKESVSKIVSSLYDGSTGLLEPYLKRNGDQVVGVDIKSLATKLAKAEIFDNVIKKIAQESKAAGAANIVKNQKNINFTAESKSTNDTKPMDVNSVLAAHFASKV
jgi:hypothetical protein